MTYEDDFYERIVKALEYELTNETGEITIKFEQGRIIETEFDIAGYGEESD